MPPKKCRVPPRQRETNNQTHVASASNTRSTRQTRGRPTRAETVATTTATSNTRSSRQTRGRQTLSETRKRSASETNLQTPSMKRPGHGRRSDKDTSTSSLTDEDISRIAEVVLQHVQAASETRDSNDNQVAVDNTDPDDATEHTENDVSGKITIVATGGILVVISSV